MPKNITMPDSVELTFTYRTDGSKDRSEAISATVVADLTGLEEKDLLEWAFSNMVIGYQSKLRGKKPPTAGEDGKYQWKVPARGSRTVADPEATAEKAGKLVEKLDAKGKYDLLVKLGTPKDVASQATGYVEPKAPVNNKKK